MPLFSVRKGLVQPRALIQVNSIDSQLRNSLWNMLYIHYWKPLESTVILATFPDYEALFTYMWTDFFRRPLDELHPRWPVVYDEIRGYFNHCEWYEVYDLIEFVANTYEYHLVNQRFIEGCNAVLEREMSAYRFVGGVLTEITSEEEISALEESLDTGHVNRPVVLHLHRALELLSDRKNPDYRNSIKESISAVEAQCQLMTSNARATLGDALKELEGRFNLHTALKKAFSDLYGYTSDADGIRHALLEESSLNFDDAKFMLVASSAFVNYLVSKAAAHSM